MNVDWPGGRNLLSLVSVISNPLSSGSSNFLCEFYKICDFWGSMIAARGLGANWSSGGANRSSGGEKYYVVYTLFCIFIIIIIITNLIISSSISLVAL